MEGPMVGNPSTVTASLRLGGFFERADDAGKLVDRPARMDFLEGCGEGSVVPQSSLLAALEALPELVAQHSIVAENGARVVDLVSKDDRQSVRRSNWKVPEVLFLALPPGRLGNTISIRAAFHNARYPFAEAPADLLEHSLSALVFHRIMKQRGDGLVFVSALLKDEGADTHQVGNVRDGRPLALLRGMQRSGVTESLLKAFSQSGFFGRHEPYRASRSSQMQACDEWASTDNGVTVEDCGHGRKTSAIRQAVLAPDRLHRDPSPGRSYAHPLPQERAGIVENIVPTVKQENFFAEA
jgi:hypothetical protein